MAKPARTCRRLLAQGNRFRVTCYMTWKQRTQRSGHTSLAGRSCRKKKPTRHPTNVLGVACDEHCIRNKVCFERLFQWNNPFDIKMMCHVFGSFGQIGFGNHVCT
eukprot:890765-Amphidinium_carterae.2